MSLDDPNAFIKVDAIKGSREHTTPILYRNEKVCMRGVSQSGCTVAQHESMLRPLFREHLFEQQRRAGLQDSVALNQKEPRPSLSGFSGRPLCGNIDDRVHGEVDRLLDSVFVVDHRSIACYCVDLAANFDSFHSSLFGSTLPFDYVSTKGPCANTLLSHH